MGNILKKAFKIILVILVVSILGALSYWACKIKGWPLWVGGILLAGAIGIWIGALFLKKYLLRRRERKFIQRVIEQDKEAIKVAPASQRLRLQELQEHWKESVNRLQQSNLRKMGNPLYVLPWYLIMGESRIGKTSAIKNARISSAMTEVSKASGISGTRNCDWWFFEEGIILDTAGRYAIPIDEGPDLEEWKQFLILLSKYRKKEPLNGVIVAISADKLLDKDESKLREDGQSLRQRIDQMMRIMGARFPVYILVTKMDLVHGFTEFIRALPPETLVQAMGYTNKELNHSWREVMEKAMNNISEKLKDLRLILLHKTKDLEPGAILFPNEFEKLSPGLEIFLGSVFEENPYQETPLFRGIYFSSALPKGKPQSEFLKVTGIDPTQYSKDNQVEGLFLRDFFTQILPKDRNLFSPILEFIRWKRIVNNLGLMAYLLIAFFICGLLGFSFYQNLSTIKKFTNVFYNPPALTDDQLTNLLMLDKMRIAILDMDKDNQGWLFPRFGLDHSIRMVDRLKDHFSDLFKHGFLGPLDEKLTKNIGKVDRNTPEDEFVNYVGYVVARITVLKEHLAGKRLTLHDEFRTIASNLLESIDRKINPAIANKFGDIYYSYLTWNKDKVDFQERLEFFRYALEELLNKKGRDLHWLVKGWIPDTPDVHLKDFWGLSEIGEARGQIIVPAAYTRDGRRHIEEFISMIEGALEDNSKLRAVFERRKRAFWKWYHRQFYLAWYLFIQRFNEAIDRIEDIATWHSLASIMNTDENPYFKLIERIDIEASYLHPKKDTPKWVSMINRLNEIRKLARSEKAKKKGSLVGSLEVKKEKIKESLEKKMAMGLAKKLLLAKAWNQYIEALEKIQLDVASRKDAYAMYSSSFGVSEGVRGVKAENSPFTDTYKKYYRFKILMGKGDNYPEVWGLVFGPLDFLIQFAANETACFLQKQWEDQVLSILSEADPDETTQILFNKTDGVVWKFLNSVAKPFVEMDELGYFARRDLRKKRLPFRKEFFQFLNKAFKVVVNIQPKYSLTLETVPMEVNDNAKAKPYASILELNCAEKKVRLENYNYPATITFEWFPKRCGDVSLEIQLPGITLHRIYKGRMGLPLFLNEFRDGTRVFTQEDFPEQKAGLKELGISWIKLSYKIRGGEEVIKLLNRIPTKVPENIISCRFSIDQNIY